MRDVDEISLVTLVQKCLISTLHLKQLGRIVFGVNIYAQNVDCYADPSRTCRWTPLPGVRPSPGLGGATPALVFTQLTPERSSTLLGSLDPKKPQKSGKFIWENETSTFPKIDGRQLLHDMNIFWPWWSSINFSPFGKILFSQFNQIKINQDSCFRTL